MSQITKAALAAVAVTLSLLAIRAPVAAQAMETVTVALAPLDSSGVSGSAVLSGTGPATGVELTLSGLRAGLNYSVRMHAGSCTSPSASAAALPDLVAEADGTATGSGALLFEGSEDVALSTVADGEHVIIVSLDTPVACGTIPALATYGTLISGSVPQAGGFGLIVFGGGSYDQLVAATGCVSESARFWATVNGEFVVLIPGAQVPAVNARFDSVFGGSIPSGTVLIGTCHTATSDAELRALGEQVFPFVEQYGYYGVCGVDGDTSNCPFTQRLRQRLQETSATLCRCQDPSSSRELKVTAFQSGGVIEASLYEGRINYELRVVRVGGTLLVDDERCVGGGGGSSIYQTITSCNHLPQTGG